MTTESFIYSSHNAMLDNLTIANRPLSDLVNGIQVLYLSDQRPWIIGYSGGKDSTTILSLIYSALLLLPKDKLTKHVYVVSSDTLVETPVVVDMIQTVLNVINRHAVTDSLPMTAHSVTPCYVPQYSR